MKSVSFYALIVAAIGSVLCSPARAADPEPDLTPLSGTYYHSPDCSDASAVLTVHFRRIPKAKRSGEFVPWKADGKIKDGIRDNSVSFTGAEVRVKEDGTVIVWATCVSFEITPDGRLLSFRGYDSQYDRPTRKER